MCTNHFGRWFQLLKFERLQNDGFPFRLPVTAIQNSDPPKKSTTNPQDHPFLKGIPQSKTQKSTHFGGSKERRGGNPEKSKPAKSDNFCRGQNKKAEPPISGPKKTSPKCPPAWHSATSCCTSAFRTSRTTWPATLLGSTRGVHRVSWSLLTL